MVLFMLFTSKIEKPGHVIQGGENQEITGTEQRTTIHSLVTGQESFLNYFYTYEV
jgi:hypothetical protein